MKLVNFKLVALFVISYCTALLVMTPVSWLMPAVEPMLVSKGFVVNDVTGNIWSGQGKVRNRDIAELDVSWQVNPSGLLLLRVPVELFIRNVDLDVSGKLIASPFGLSLSGVSGYVDERAAKTLLSRYRVDIKGRLQLDDLAANMSWRQRLGEASGNMSWSGGPISMPVGRSIQNYEVPTMLGTITSDEQRWLLTVTGTDREEYIQGALTREGMGTLSVKRPLAVKMNIPVPGNGSSLFDISQQVLNGL